MQNSKGTGRLSKFRAPRPVPLHHRPARGKTSTDSTYKCGEIREQARGDRANWGLLSRRLQFERDIEEEIYDALLDYGTSSLGRPSTIAILAPAGYGTTTLLRSLAVRLCEDRAGVVSVNWWKIVGPHISELGIN